MTRISVREAAINQIRLPTFSPSILPPGYEKYFAVGYADGFWTLDVESYAGLVPCGNGVVIQIEPKVATRNITYMLLKSGYLNHSLETPFESTVPYQIATDNIASFFEALVYSFLQQLDRIRALGLVRTERLLTSIGTVKGKIDQSGYLRDYPKTWGVHVPRRHFEATTDNKFNQLLYHCLLYLLRNRLLIVPREAVLDRLAYLPSAYADRLTRDDVLDIRRALEHGDFPASRSYYLPALNLALLILANVGVEIGETEDVEFYPMLIPTARMFEGYIRNVCSEHFLKHGIIVVDGKKRPEPFFEKASKQLSLKPDLLFRKGGRHLTVVDVKYKFGPKSDDYYQMWAYLEGLGVERGSFVCVGSRLSTEPDVAIRDNRVIYSYVFDTRSTLDSEKAMIEFISRELLRL